MLRKLLWIALLPIAVFSTVTIDFPKNGDITNKERVPLQFKSSVQQGFLLLNGRLHALGHQAMPFLDLNLGENQIDVGLVDEDLKYYPRQQRSLHIYRSVQLNDHVTPFESRLITDLLIQHQIRLFEVDNSAKMASPVLKRDMYAMLIYFLNRSADEVGAPSQLKWGYDDMFGYDHYMALYATRSEWLPRPIHQNFYPNAYVTRRDFVNLLMLLKGIPMQVSTSMHVSESINIPSELKTVVPKNWRGDPLEYVSKRDVVDVLLGLFNIEPNAVPTALSIPVHFQNSEGQMNRRYVAALGKLKHFFVDSKNKYAQRRQAQLKKQANVPMSAPLVAADSAVSKKPPVFKLVKVAPGDSIQAIARRYLGQAADWQRLVKYNDLPIRKLTIDGNVQTYVHIVPGQTIKIPINELAKND